MKSRCVTALALLLGCVPACAAADGLLARLQSASDAEVELELADEAGSEVLDPALSAAIWRLEPGDPIEEPDRPADRAIELYSGTAVALDLFARVVVRYFRAPSGWVPHFRLDERPVVARIDGRWQPLLLPGGAGPLVRYGHVLPNAEGFFSALQFGPPAGTLTIAGWRVH